MQIEHSRSRRGIFIGFGILAVLAVLAALPFLFFRPKSLVPPFEVQNFVGPAEIYSRSQNAWVPLGRGELIQPNDIIRTGKGGEVDLRIPDQIRIRVKENSQAEGVRPKFFEREPVFRFHLLVGSILGTTEKSFAGPLFEITTPVSVNRVRTPDVSFHIHSSPETNKTFVGILRGTMEVVSITANKSTVAHGIQKLEVTGEKNSIHPVKVSQEDWEEMKEAYELIQKSAAFEAHQMDLSKEGGSLFRYVFDHGTFYTPKFGFCDREFIKDESTGRVRLEVEYDVFPVGSFVGMYMKTRDLDLSRFRLLQFEVRGDPEQGFPESFRVEIKSGSGTVAAFAPRDFKPHWQTFKFPLRFDKATPVSEITFVFANDKVGLHKKGVLHVREVVLDPR